MPTVIIVGSGIGGLSLAHGLLKNNTKNKTKFNVKIFERDTGPKDRLQGYHILTKPFGVKSLLNCLPTNLSCRLKEVFPDPIAGEEYHYSIIDQYGELLTSFPTKKYKNLYEFSETKDRNYTFMVTFRDKLREFLLQGLDIQWNKKFVKYEIDETGVWAYFNDGTKEFGDILVGCDGVNSLVRKQKLPNLATKYMGISCVIFDVAPGKDLVERLFKASSGNNIFKRSMGDRGDTLALTFRLLPIETGDPQDDTIRYRLSLSYTYPSSYDDCDKCDYDNEDNVKNFNTENNQPRQVIDWLKRIITEKRENSEFNDIIKELINLIPENPPSKNFSFNNYRPPSKFPLRDIDPKSVGRWKINRVTLLGDSIHAMNPALSLGTSNAMRDADVLSHSLLNWDEEGWEKCIEDYENEMIKRCSNDVLRSRKKCQQTHVARRSQSDILFRNWSLKISGLCLNAYSVVFD